MLNEIKKELYRQKPVAYLVKIYQGVIYYTANIDSGPVNFEVPVSDLGDASFEAQMDAKLLIRWLVDY